LRTARRVGLFESPALQERTCAQSPWLPVISFLVLSQASATVAEEDLEGPDADNLRRRP